MATRYYPALIHQDEGSRPEDGYSVVFLDFPGCVSGGDTVREAAEAAIEALALHVEGMVEDSQKLPEPSAPGVEPEWLPDVPGQAIATVLVPVDLPGRTVRANITIDEALLSRIDARAAADGTTRSGFLAQAARERLAMGR